jgi:hypothetical protein
MIRSKYYLYYPVYQNVKIQKCQIYANFLQRSARFCTLLSNFCKFLQLFTPFFDVFFLPILSLPPMLPFEIYLQTKIEHPHEKKPKKLQFSPNF